MFLTQTHQSQAAWIDDYFANAVSTAPTAVNSQSRGYYTAGGFTARVPYKKEPLMTASLPTIQTGCGGIDMFWGGISFMNADYLVQKAKGVLQNAPYVLFSIGLKSLSSQFGDTIESVQAITDQLNQLQLDECSAAKGVISFAMGEEGAASGLLSEWDRLQANTANLKDGIGKTWDKIRTQTDNDPQAQVTAAKDRKIKDVKAREFLMGKGYVLDKLATADANWGYITQDEANLIRALVGDVYYDNTGTESIFTYKSGCAAEIKFDDYLYEPTPVQTSAQLAAGEDCTYNGLSIAARTNAILDALYNGYIDKASSQIAFTADTINFLNRAEIPVMTFLSTASSAGSEYLGATMHVMNRAVASGYAYGSLKNISAIISRITFKLRNSMMEQDYSEGFIRALNQYERNIRLRLETFENEYSIIMERMNTTFELARKSELAAKEIENTKKGSFLFQGVSYEK